MLPEDPDLSYDSVAHLSTLANLSTEEIVRECLSYRDAPDTSEKEKEDLFRRTLDFFPDSSRAYAEGLRMLVATHGAEKVSIATGRMLAACHEVLGRLQIEVSSRARSRTWACWDMGKQYHYLHHPQKANPDYSIEDPLSSSKKFQEIVDRHVGWELFNTRSRPTSSLRKAYADHTEIRELLDMKPKDNGTLSSKNLALLGCSVRTALGVPDESL